MTARLIRINVKKIIKSTIEDTTSIYSGILRMADLLALQPMLDIKKTLVYYGNYKNNGEHYAMVKPTHIWSNIELWVDETQPEMDESTYIIKFHKYHNCEKRVYKQNMKSAKEKSVIPSELIEKIFNCFNQLPFDNNVNPYNLHINPCEGNSRSNSYYSGLVASRVHCCDVFLIISNSVNLLHC